jgi:hypothetical protein
MMRGLRSVVLEYPDELEITQDVERCWGRGSLAVVPGIQAWPSAGPDPELHDGFEHLTMN